MNAALSTLALAGLLGAASAAEPPARPNVVVILADDLGYGDVRCYNPERCRIPTPNIDRIAEQGMRFTDAHSSSSVCSPTRYSLLTGRYHWRTRLQKGIVNVWEPPLIAPERLTLPGLLRRAGYRTACIGKWHLGWEWPMPPEAIESLQQLARRNREELAPTDEQIEAWRVAFSRPIAGGPVTRGFDVFFGVDLPNWPPFCFIEQDRTVGIPSRFLPAALLGNNQASLQGPAVDGWTLEPVLPRLIDRACEEIARLRAGGAPYFLYLSLTAPHTPLAVNEPWRGQSGLNAYADFVIETDAMVGRVLAAVDAGGGRDDTLVVFTSDNGCAPYIGVKDLEQKGHFPSGPLRGYKSDVFEGGHRVPFLVRWPGVVAAGSVCGQTVGSIDLMATLAAVVGESIPPDAGEDAVSLLPLLLGDDRPVRRALVHQSIHGTFAIREGRWKLIFGRGSGGWTEPTEESPRKRNLPMLQLYDLAADLGESTNLAEERPDVVARLTQTMREYVEDGRSTRGPAQPNDVPPEWPDPQDAKRSN